MLFLVKLNPEYRSWLLVEGKGTCALFLFLLAAKKKVFVVSFRWDTIIFTANRTTGSAAVCKVRAITTPNYKQHKHSEPQNTKLNLFTVTFLATENWTEVNLRWLIIHGSVKREKNRRSPPVHSPKLAEHDNFTRAVSRRYRDRGQEIGKYWVSVKWGPDGGGWRMADGG